MKALSINPAFLRWLSMSELRTEIAERRRILREHRDAKGDNRCWISDYSIFAFLEDSEPLTRPADHKEFFEQFLRKCADFHRFNNATHLDPTPITAILDPAKWDVDISKMDYAELFKELMKLQTASFNLREISKRRPTTCDDYRILYQVLPEKIPADLRLPDVERFVGRSEIPTESCPNFLDSHKDCNPKTCNLFEWGHACTKKLRITLA